MTARSQDGRAWVGPRWHFIYGGYMKPLPTQWVRSSKPGTARAEVDRAGSSWRPARPPGLGDEKKTGTLAAFGVRAVARARRYQVGKYFNFEQARVQFF